MDMLETVDSFFAWMDSKQYHGSEEVYSVALDPGLLWNAWGSAGCDNNNGIW